MANKKILILIGSPRKRETWRIAHQFGDVLVRQCEATIEYLFLKDLNMQPCCGCFLCLTKGKEFCPHKDDRQVLVGKIMVADGVVLATPNYSLQVTAIVKNALDRIAYTFHRPCFFGKRFMAIVTQGATGGRAILRYLKNVAQYTGYIHISGVVVNTVTPRTGSEQCAINRAVEAGAERYNRALAASDSPRPPLVMVAIFRMVRSMYRATPDEELKDVRYWRENGWFASSYYYPVRLGVLHTVIGALADRLGRSFALKRRRDLAVDNGTS